MNSASGFSAAHAVPNTNMGNTVYAVECVWLSQFWPPQAIHADGALHNRKFRTFLDTNGISLRPGPPRRHAKNVCEPRHRIIRSIFIRLRQADPVISTSLNAIRAVRVSNDIYGNDIASAFELAKGFTRPIDNETINPLPPELQQAHLDILTRRKLNIILRSHALIQNRLRKGDLVQVFINNSSDKRGTWTSPRQIVELNTEAGCISVPGCAGKLVRAAFEDVRIAPNNDTLDEQLQSAIDDLDGRIDDALLTTSRSQRYNDTTIKSDNANIGYDSPDPIGSEDIDDGGDEGSHPPGDFTADQPAQPTVGARIQIYWPLDDKFYDEEITNVDTNGMCTVLYDDDEVEQLNLNAETWLLSNAAHASSANISPILSSSDQTVLREMMSSLGQRPFLYHLAQGFEQAVMVKAYDKKEARHLDHAKVVARSKVPPDANIISGHVVYKIKVMDDNGIKLKARIAPYGNEDSDTRQLRSDCAMCPPLGIRIILSVCVVRRWSVAGIDVETAFHQTGAAARQIYVRPPRE